METIHPTQSDVTMMSDRLVEQLLRHNELVLEHCH